MKKRRYRLGRRAESQQQTRDRIVAATVELHEERGPRATTISAIADRAGVQRLTVYRHFPDEDALFDACSAHWMAAHPPPDPAAWRAVNDWRARCRAALAAVYRYYRRNAGMLASVTRDADMPSMEAPMRGFVTFRRQTCADLLDGAPAQGKAVAGTIAHLLTFTTWQALADGFSDAEMVDLAMAWIDGAVAAA